MSLTKEQIKHIDNYLKSKQLKYWDIRLEMVDHLASKLEQEPNLILDEALLKQEFGDFFQVRKREQLISIAISKKFRKQVFNQVKLFLNQFIGWVFLIAFYLLEFLIFKNLNHNLSIKINVLIFILSLTPTSLYSIKKSLQRNKSKHLEVATKLTFMTFSILNSPIMLLLFLNPQRNILASNNFWLALFLMIIIPIHLLFTFCGFKIFIKTKKEYTHLFNEQHKINATQ